MESQISKPMDIVIHGNTAESKMIINSVMPNNGSKMHQKVTREKDLPQTQEKDDNCWDEIHDDVNDKYGLFIHACILIDLSSQRQSKVNIALI